MKKLIALGMAIVLLLSLGVGGVFASDHNPNASAKATAQIDCLNVMSVAYTTEPDDVTDVCDAQGKKILEQTIKTANDKDLIIDVSLQSAVFTGTTVKSKNMERDTSAAAAAVVLRVWIDKGKPGERLVFPGIIVYNARLQVLTAKLQGVIPDIWPGTITTPEEIGLFIGTMSANSFNFIVDDLDAGMHTVTVEAACASWVMNQQGCAQAVAVIGLGSMTVEEVRMVKGEDAII
jgi:hypothetical protein